MGASLCRLFVSTVFCVRAGFDMGASHIFPQGVLAALPFREGVFGVGVYKACAESEAGLPLCSMAVSALSGVGFAPKLLE